jgi:hypothetical protein
MDHSMTVGVVERIGDLRRDPDGFLDPDLGFPVELLSEGLTLDEGHDVKGEAVGGARLEEGEDVGVLERDRRLDLLDEALGPCTAASSGLRTLRATLRSCLRSAAR